MSKFTHLLLTSLVISLTLSASLLILTGCGGSDSAAHGEGSGGGGSVTRIQGTSASIDKAVLNHWMRSMAGGDYRASIGVQGPRGLVSEPANYGECASAAKTFVPRTPTGQLKLSDAQIAQKCRQLYQSIKAQALSFLISVQWTVAEGAEQGLKVTDADLRHEFARFWKERYPTKQEFEKYIAERQWVLSDVLYQLKRNILVGRILPKFKAKVNRAGGGEQLYVKFALERYKALIAKTSCRAGYVVPNCKEYSGPPIVAPAPNIILEYFAQGRSS